VERVPHRASLGDRGLGDGPGRPDPLPLLTLSEQDDCRARNAGLPSFPAPPLPGWCPPPRPQIREGGGPFEPGRGELVIRYAADQAACRWGCAADGMARARRPAARTARKLGSGRAQLGYILICAFGSGETCLAARDSHESLDGPIRCACESQQASWPLAGRQSRCQSECSAPNAFPVDDEASWQASAIA